MTSHFTQSLDFSDEEGYLTPQYPNSGIASKKINTWTCDPQDIADAGPSGSSHKAVNSPDLRVSRNLPRVSANPTNNESSLSPSKAISNSTCLTCSRTFKNINGLKIHTGKVHPLDSSQCLIAENVCDASKKASLHSQLAKLKSSTRILKRVPKAARPLAAMALSKVINACIKDNSFCSWSNLLLFAYKSFNVSHSSNQKKISLSSQIKKNITDSDSPVPNSTRDNNFSRRQTRSKDTEISFCKRIMSKISDGDITSAVKILSSSDSFAPFDSTYLSELINKHPSPLPTHDKFPKFSTELPTFFVTKDEVLAAVNAFKVGSAGGLDSFRPSHFRDMLSYSSGIARENLLSSLTDLCNLMLSGKVYKEICPILYGASLIALKKKDGSARPIAIGCFFRRLVAKICCFKIRDQLGEKFRPLQFGFGSPGGCEAVAHSARIYLSNNSNIHEKAFLKIDFKNAFNMIRRDYMLQIVMENTPELFPFINQCYRSPSFLMFGENVISSARGVQQGDPLGPALFCLSIDSLTRSLSTEYNCWYLDDGSVGDTINNVLNNFEVIIKKSSEVGLEVNFQKCELFFFTSQNPDVVSQFNDLAPGIRVVDKSNWCLLGAPLTNEALPTSLAEKSESLSLLCSRLELLPSHAAFYLLKNCLAIPKLTYLLRCSPCWRCEEGLSNIDIIIRRSIENITNNTFSENSWLQATLPISKGGLGIRSAASLSLPSFLSSFSAVKKSISNILKNSSHLSLDSVFDEGEYLWSAMTSFHLPSEKLHIQKAWDTPLVDISLKKLHESATINNFEKARLIAVSSVHSGDWLRALPAASLGTLLDNFSFRIAIGLRLGCRICVPHKCICGNQVDELGTHGLSCIFSAGRHSRHHAVNDLIKRALISAGIPSVLEPTGTCRDDGKRPDGMTLIPWQSGKALVWDFTCVDTIAKSHIRSTSSEAGAAALAAEKLKSSKYQNISNQYILVPVAVETFGSWGPRGLKFIQQIGSKIEKITGDKRATSFLFQRISIAVQRGNAASICGTFPQSQALDEIFFI